MLSGHALQHHALTAASRNTQQQRQPGCWSRRLGVLTLCRHERRKSANNYATRTKEGRRQRSSGLLVQEPYATAADNVVAKRARMLQAGTKGQLAFQLCLFVFTEQPQLLSINTKHLAARVLLLAEVLGLPVPDAAELLVRCPALLDVLPLRLRSAAEALGSALDLTQAQALFMLASDLNLMDTPPLRVRQYLEGLGQLLGAPWQLVAQLAWQCPHLLRVEAAALQLRWAGLQAALGVNAQAVQQLLLKEPRLLMPDSQTLGHNHAAVLTTLNISHTTLSRWVLAAPMLLLVPAQQLHKRLQALGQLLAKQGQQLVDAAAAAAAAEAEAGAFAGDVIAEGASFGDVEGVSAGVAAAAAAADTVAASADAAAGAAVWPPEGCPLERRQFAGAAPPPAGDGFNEAAAEGLEEEAHKGEEGWDGAAARWGQGEAAESAAAELAAAAAVAAATEETSVLGTAFAAPQEQAEPVQADLSTQYGSSNGGSNNGSSSDGSGTGSGSNNSSSSGSKECDLQWQCVAADPLQLLAYISKDPRVLLLSVDELPQKLPQLASELTAGPEGLSRELAAWLVLSHPSYLAAEPGVISNWCHDVTHLTGMTSLQAKRLAVCPQVFLTLAPEDVLAALDGLCQALNLTISEQPLRYSLLQAAAVAADEPLLLVQHPSSIAAAAKQLQGLLPLQGVRRQLLDSAPQILLQGQQLRQVFVQLANLLTVSCAQLAVMLVKDPGVWVWLVPRHTWPTCPQWRQQQQQQSGHVQLQQDPISSSAPSAAAAAGPSAAAAAAAGAAAGVQLAPAAAAAAATMAALMSCGLQAPQSMQTAVVLHPALLRLSPQEALAYVQALQDVCGRCASWEQQLQGDLSPDDLGKALTRAFSWRERLLFLVATGWARGLHLGEVVQMTVKEFHSQFGVQYTWYLEQRHQHQQQQQHLRWQEQQWQEEPVQQQEQQQWQEQPVQQQWQQELQDRAGLQQQGNPLAEPPPLALSAGSSSAVHQQHDSMATPAVMGPSQHTDAVVAAEAAAATAGDVYYETYTASAHASSLDGDGGNSSSVRGGQQMWAEPEQQQQQQLVMGSPPGELDAQQMYPDQQQAWFQQQQQQQQGPPPVRWPWQQDQQQQQQHLPGSEDHLSSGKHPHPLLASSVRRSVSRRGAAVAAVQLSGLELYGTWLGCLVQPVDAAVEQQQVH